MDEFSSKSFPRNLPIRVNKSYNICIIFYLVCTNMDLVVTGERFECSCNTHYSTSNGTSEVLCDLQGPFYLSYSL